MSERRPVADGQRQATILEAEGSRQAEILRAEGHALALAKIFEAARTIDSKTMTLQYLEALKSLGESPSTKMLVPVELTALLRPLFEHVDRAGTDGGERRSGRHAVPAMSTPAHG